MVNLLAEAPGRKPFSFGFKPVSASVLRADAYFLRSFHQAVLIRNTETALRAALFPFGGDDFRVEQFNKIRLLAFRNICLQNNDSSPQNADLRGCKTDAVFVNKCLSNIVH